MNGPEGWKLVPIKPTKEMKAACRVAGKTQVWDDMIAAAPTPEVEPFAYMWNGEVFSNCKMADPAKRVNAVIKENGYPLYDHPAPTPEVEPVAVRDNGGKNGIRWLTVDFPEEGLLLYTRPAPSDELVKAASELADCFDQDVIKNVPRMIRCVKNLRAALDKVKP